MEPDLKAGAGLLCVCERETLAVHVLEVPSSANRGLAPEWLVKS